MELWWTTLWIHNETRRFLCEEMRIKNTFRISYFASYKVYDKARKTSNYAQVMPIMPLCKYFHEYVMPEDGFFTIELVLETAFWRTRLLLQKVTLKSSRWHHSLYYRIWQFYETMRVAQGLPMGDTWVPFSTFLRVGEAFVPSIISRIRTIMWKTEKMTKNLLPIEIILITHGTCSIISRIASAYLSHNCPMGSAQKWSHHE